MLKGFRGEADVFFYPSLRVADIVERCRELGSRVVVTALLHLFVADHLCAAFAVVEVVGNANHAHGVEVIC